MTAFSRNVPLLAISQALMMSSTSLIVATAALVGFALAEDKSLATLPLAAQFIATMLTSIPAAMLMQKIGRKKGFMLASLLGMSAALIASYAIIDKNFWLFVAATSLVGMFNGFGTYFRFTAADIVDDAHKSRAISYVLAGGVVAAVIGPNLAKYSRQWIDSAEFAGSYGAILVLYMLILFALSFLRLPDHLAKLPPSGQHTARPLWQIVRQKKFIVAMLCGMLGYGVMSFVMTATPLAMSHHQHPFDDTSFVIQWHVLAMFAPSFFTGHLMKYAGKLPIMLLGTLLGLACVLINLNGHTVTHFWIALICLGVSWNFLFVGATSLLTETYGDGEQGKAQAINDFIIYTTVAISSLSAGALQHRFGWQMVNIGVIPLLLVIALSIVYLGWFDRKERATRP